MKLEAPWGPWISAGPETQLHENLASVWVDKTPIGVGVQFAVKKRQVVVGWIFKRPRFKVRSNTRGFMLFRRSPSIDECDHDDE